jgi:hypothetical protein
VLVEVNVTVNGKLGALTIPTPPLGAFGAAESVGRACAKSGVRFVDIDIVGANAPVTGTTVYFTDTDTGLPLTWLEQFESGQTSICTVSEYVAGASV